LTGDTRFPGHKKVRSRVTSEAFSGDMGCKRERCAGVRGVGSGVFEGFSVMMICVGVEEGGDCMSTAVRVKETSDMTLVEIKAGELPGCLRPHPKTQENKRMNGNNLFFINPPWIVSKDLAGST
jgi:hypothetical protein